MRKYNNLRKKINQMAKAFKGSIAPYIAYLDKIQNGYELRICFWDGKEGSADKMPAPIVYQFSKYEDAEESLLNYLEENKPFSPFVLFSNEELILE
jgi:hypothetical protein